VLSASLDSSQLCLLLASHVTTVARRVVCCWTDCELPVVVVSAAALACNCRARSFKDDAVALLVADRPLFGTRMLSMPTWTAQVQCTDLLRVVLAACQPQTQHQCTVCVDRDLVSLVYAMCAVQVRCRACAGAPCAVLPPSSTHAWCMCLHQKQQQFFGPLILERQRLDLLQRALSCSQPLRWNRGCRASVGPYSHGQRGCIRPVALSASEEHHSTCPITMQATAPMPQLAAACRT
jgi:hypothetical protein